MTNHVGLFSRDVKGNQKDEDHGHKLIPKSHVEPDHFGVHKDDEVEVLCKPDRQVVHQEVQKEEQPNANSRANQLRRCKRLQVTREFRGSGTPPDAKKPNENESEQHRKVNVMQSQVVQEVPRHRKAEWQPAANSHDMPLR